MLLPKTRLRTMMRTTSAVQMIIRFRMPSLSEFSQPRQGERDAAVAQKRRRRCVGESGQLHTVLRPRRGGASRSEVLAEEIGLKPLKGERKRRGSNSRTG